MHLKQVHINDFLKRCVIKTWMVQIYRRKVMDGRGGEATGGKSLKKVHLYARSPTYNLHKLICSNLKSVSLPKLLKIGTRKQKVSFFGAALIARHEK